MKIFKGFVINSIGCKTIASIVLVAFLLNNGIAPIHYAYAQEAFQLPQPGTRISLSPTFMPPLLKGVKVYHDNPFKLDFILDKGDSSASREDLKVESTRLIKYFLASITVPENDLWVNLSPYEKDRIVPDGFGVTEMGRDLLAQDYILKQITASVIYPEEKIGKEFWDKVYTEAQYRFGSTDVPVDTFNKVWIVPEKAVVYENKDSAYVVESRLKVLLEEDYLALEKGMANVEEKNNAKETNKIGAKIVREVVIPIIEKEVNEGKNFAQLRQVYHSLILALWFKDKIRESILGQAYVDRDKVSGIDIADKATKEKIWVQYVEAFKKGAYNYIKEDYDVTTQQLTPRKYFSGGAGLFKTRSVLVRSQDASQLPHGVSDRAMVIMSNLYPYKEANVAQTSYEDLRFKLKRTFSSAKSYEDRVKGLLGRKQYEVTEEGYRLKGSSGIVVGYHIGKTDKDGDFLSRLVALGDKFREFLPDSLKKKIAFLDSSSYHVTVVDLGTAGVQYENLRTRQQSMVESFFWKMPEKFHKTFPATVIGIDMFEEPGVLKFKVEMSPKTKEFLDDFGRSLWEFLSKDEDLRAVYQNVKYKPGNLEYHISFGYLMDALSSDEVDLLVAAMQKSSLKENNIVYEQPVGALCGYNEQNPFFYIVNPVGLLIKNPDLKVFIKRYLTHRYVHWGLPAVLAGTIIDTLVAHGDDLDRARDEVYKIIDFAKDSQWKDAYAKYQEAVKYESAFTNVRKYFENLKPESVVVDLGAGNNVFGAMMASQLPHVKVIGADITDYHESRNLQNLTYLKQPSPTKLPEEIKAHSVDVITLNAVLHHIASGLLPDLLAEIKRVLKPGGKVIVIEDTYSERIPMRGMLDEELTQDFFGLVHKFGVGIAKDFFTFNDWYSNIVVHKWDGMATPYEFRSIEEWQAIFLKAGFSSLDTQNLGFSATGFHKPSLGIIVFHPQDYTMLIPSAVKGWDPMKVRVRLSEKSNLAVVYLHGMDGNIDNNVGQWLEASPIDMTVVRYTSSRMRPNLHMLKKDVFENMLKEASPEDGEKIFNWLFDMGYFFSPKDNLEAVWINRNFSIGDIVAKVKNKFLATPDGILEAVRKVDWIRYTFGNKEAGEVEKTFDDEITELKQVVDATIQKLVALGRGPLQIVLVGESLGGTIVSIIAHELEAKGVKGIVSINGNLGYDSKKPPATFDHPITGKIPESQIIREEFGKFKGKTLIIRSEKDDPDRNESALKWKEYANPEGSIDYVDIPSVHNINSNASDSEIAIKLSKDLEQFLSSFISGHVVESGRLPENSPEELFRVQYKATYPDKEDLYEDNPVHRQGNYRRLYDAISGLFGVDFSDDNQRLNKGKRLLELLYRQGDERLITDAISHLGAYTYVASGAHRLTPIALAIKNQFLGRNLFSPDAINDLIALDPEFRWLRTAHPFYAEPGIYEETSVGALPQLNLPPPVPKKVYRTLDIGAAPKNYGSVTQNLMRRLFDNDADLKGHAFEMAATDIFFPIFEEKAGKVQRRVDADLPDKVINGVHYYDALRFSPHGGHAADVTSGDFNKHGELGRFDYITMTATFHHLAKTTGEVFEDLPLADVVLKHADGTPFEEKYFMAHTQQKVLTNLLNSLEDGGVFFLNLTLSKTPELQYEMTGEQAERHMTQHFMERSNADNYIIIRRQKDHFIVYDDVISYRPSGEREGTEDSLLRGEVGFYTKVKISDAYPGVALGDENYKKIKAILRQADMQVFWHQGLNKSRWGRVMAAAKTIELGASFSEWLEVYMSNVPASDAKRKIIEAAKELHQELLVLPHIQVNQEPIKKEIESLSDVDGFDGLFRIDKSTGRIYYGDRSKAVKFNVPVYAVRHAQSVAQTLRWTVQSKSISEEETDRLSETGVRQAAEAASDLYAQMMDKGALDKDCIVLISQLVRAKETATPFLKYVNQKLGRQLPVEHSGLINELNVGIRGYLSADQMTPEIIRIRDQVWNRNAEAKLPSGESYLDLLQRAKNFILYVNQHYKGKKLIIFTHSLFMNALRIVQGEGDWEIEDGFLDWNKNKAENAELWSFEPNGEGVNTQGLDNAQKSQEEKAESLGFHIVDHEAGYITYGENFKPFDLRGIELVVVPHGLTDGDIEGVLQVSKDVDDPRFQLNAEGWRQVEHGAEVIWDQYGDKIKSGQVVFYRSGTRRTAQTAEAFIKYANSKVLGVVKDVRISDAIRMNLGAWEGATKVQIDTVLPPDERNRARKFIKRNALIGPKDGQTYVDYLFDVRDFLNSLKRENIGKTVVIFGHGIFIKTVKVLLQTSDIISTPFLDWNSGGGSSYKLGMPLVMNELSRKEQGAKNGLSAWRKENTRRYSVEELAAYAANVRLEGLKIWRKLKGPLAGAMSPVDLYTVLLMDYVDREKFVSKHPQRLRIIPKGTAGSTFYSAAAYAGLVEPDRVANIRKDDLEIVPTRFGLSEVSLYKMGTSFEQGIGLALASKIKQVDYPVMVFLTDGGLQLGIDHQAKFAAHMGLNNLTVVVDVNRLQNAYRVEDVDPTLALDVNGHLSRLIALWEAYGWDVVEIDGHDFQQIRMAYDKIGQGEKPLVILAKTTKGRGMTEIEGRLNFSHKFPSEDDYQRAVMVLQGTAEEYRANNYDIKYPDWIPVQRMAFDNQGFALPRSDLIIDEDPMQFERPLSDQGKMYLEKVLKSWLHEFISANPNQVFVINTDNPSPFELSTPIRSSTNQSPFIFAGINERFALNLAGGMFLEGLAPIYIGPAAHMPVNAEDWKMLGLGKQNVLVVARSSGSALSYWGPGHLVYEDVELFKNPWSQVLQPAHAQDLMLILENYYRSYPNGKPTYLRMQEVYPFDLPMLLFDTEEKRRNIYKDGFYLTDSFEGFGEPVVFVVSGKTVKEAMDAGRELRKAGVSFKVINVFNLSSINNEKLGALAKGSSRIITAIDALPQSLSSLVFDALPEQRSSVMAFGVKDGGSSDPEVEIFTKNRIDSMSFIGIGVKENAIRPVANALLRKLNDSEDSRLIRESWEQALKDPDNSVIKNLTKVYLSAGREVGDRLVHTMIGLGEDVSDPWTANYLISDLVSLFGVKLLGQNMEGLRAIVRDHEIKLVLLGITVLSEEEVAVNKNMSLSELREAVRDIKLQQKAAVLSTNGYKEIARNVQKRNIRFMQQIIPVLIQKIWRELDVDNNSSAVLYFNDIKTAASDLDVVYVGPEQAKVDRRLTELCNLLGIKRDLSAVVLINRALSEGRGNNFSGYQYGGNIASVSINGGDFDGFYQTNLKLRNPEVARKMHEDRLRGDLLKKWAVDVEKNIFRMENLKSVYGAAVNDLLKSLVLKFGLSYGVYDDIFWENLGKLLSSEDLGFLRDIYELINQARSLAQYVTERRWDVADSRVAGIVDQLLTQQGVHDYRQIILTAKKRIDALMEQYLKDDTRVIADKYQGRADKNWDAIASLYDLIIKDRFIDSAHLDSVMKFQSKTSFNKGGIDLIGNKIEFQVGSSDGTVYFNFDPAMIQQLQNATGLMPVIIDIRPMTTSVPMFLGLKGEEK